MFFRELRKIARPHWFDILFRLKQSKGLSVTALAKAMKMSYMGVKQHCEDLEKLGYLETRRQPREKGGRGGRPEKRYRVTEKASVFFPNHDNELFSELMLSLRDAYGAHAPEKLILAYLSKKADFYRDHIPASDLLTRAQALVKLRQQEGHVATCEGDENSVVILEFHHPMHAIFAKHPATVRMERQLFERVLNCRVQRSEEESHGLSHTRMELFAR